MKFSLEALGQAIAGDAAMRRRRVLQPAGGRGDKVFPSTYPDESKSQRGGKAAPGHVVESRRIDGEEVKCVLIDSVQSQTNRMEEALLAGLRARAFFFPYLEVDFRGAEGLADIGGLSSLEAPHRVFDAIFRDSEIGGVAFPQSEAGLRLAAATPRNATALFELSPSSLTFGCWNSTGQGGGLGAKFARNITSEIIGVNAVLGKRTSSRIDPLGIRNMPVYGSPTDWSLVKPDEKAPKQLRPSEIMHSNIAPSVVDGLGVTIDYAQQTAVLSFAGLRKLSFPNADGTIVAERDASARAVLAAIAIAALTEQDQAGYALRSRCDLVLESEPENGFAVVHADGTTSPVSIDAKQAAAVLVEAIDRARAAGFNLASEPLRLTPSKQLAELVRRSRALALRNEGEANEDEAAS